MADKGKIKATNRWKGREARGINTALQVLSKTIQVAPMKDGSISVQLGPPNGMGIHFVIEPQIVFNAAQAGITFAEELMDKEFKKNVTTETDTQPVGGE